MVLCKFFQQGSCRFGSKCVNEHFDVKQVIKTDVESAINGKQWPLSTYGPFKDKPSIPNFIEDQSFEEVRMLCYEAKQKNFFDQFHQQFNKEALEASNKMKALLQMTPDIIDVAINIYDLPSDASCSGVGAGKTTNTTNSNNPFGMANAPATNAGSIFAKSNTNTTINATNNLFGNNNTFGATTQATPGIFGNSSGFTTQPQQQQTSIFGQAAKPANSIFGGGTTTNAQQKSSIFGQQQAQPSVFASSGPQQQQASAGLFAQQNQFVQQQPQQNSNIFRQATQPQQGLFAQAAQTMQQPQQPQQQQGLFAQAAQQTLGQNPQAGQGLFAQAAQQSQNIFGQAMQQQQQTTNTNIFQQNSPNSGQQTNSNMFQQTQQQAPTQQPPSGLFQQAALQTQNSAAQSNQLTNVSPTLYSRLEDLTADEIEAFKDICFQPGKIPFNPPPRELIH
ncbi:uncharacterized protein LOC135950311 [Calliphora vicina]|uniref:uncharacterized protein LOC135950311 n=1 Tax=Calliphora vicina TaxID=7373 RepID=UPI00325AA1D8